MTGFLTCLVGHVFLHTGIQQSIRQTRRKVQGALLAVNNIGNLPAYNLVAELDLLPFVKPVEYRTAQFLNSLRRHQVFLVHIKGLIEIDVRLVVCTPEFVMGRRDDLIEIV